MPARSSMIYSLEIGAASGATPGDIDSATGVPDTSGVTFVPWSITGGVRDAMGGGAERFNGEEHARRTPGLTSLLPTGLFNVSASTLYGAPTGTQFVAFEIDTIQAQARMRGWGTTDPAGTPEGLALASAFAVRVPGQVSITASDIGADLGEIPVTDASAIDVVVGDVLIRADGVSFSSHEVVDVDEVGNTIQVHPYMTSLTANGTEFACARVYYPSVDDDDYGADVHLMFNMGGDGADASVRRLAPLCRLQSLALEPGDGGVVVGTWTFKSTVMLTDDSNASTVASSERQQPAIMADVGTRLQLGPDHSALTAPISAALDGADLARFSFSINIENTVGMDAYGGESICGTDDVRITQSVARLTLECQDSGDASNLHRMLADGEVRQIVVNYGPGWVVGAGDARGTPKGMAFLARMGRDSGERAVAPGDGDTIRQSVTLRAVNDGPNLSAGTTALANAPWRLAIPMGS